MAYQMESYDLRESLMDTESLFPLEFDLLQETQVYGGPELWSIACASPEPLSSPKEPSQHPVPSPMPHELTQLQNLLIEHPQAVEQLFDEACEVELDSEGGNQSEKVQYGKDGKYMGWTVEDNVNFSNLLAEMLKDQSADTEQRIFWREITEKFNKRTGQERSKIQLYSHYRYLLGRHRMPCYLKAEEEVMLALDELGVEPRWMPPFLKTERSEDVLATKLKRLKTSGKDKAERKSAQANFRRKIKDIMRRSGGLEAIKTNKMPRVAIELVRRLVDANSHLRKKYNVLKQPGRPPKQTKVVPVTQKLKTLFRPFIFVTKRRKRTTCYPGDARKYGMNLFCLNRLLGSPLELSKMPNDLEEAVKAGVPENEYPQYRVLRELMLAHAKEMPQSDSSTLPAELRALTGLKPQAHLADRKNYASSEDPPAECILPPTLYTLTGLRGLLSYRETLKAIVEESDFSPSATSDFKFGDPEADKRFMKSMLSLFQSAWNLSEVPGEPAENSDGDSDSDEEVCFAKHVPVEQSVDRQEEFLFDQMLNEGTSSNSSTTDRTGIEQVDWHFMDGFSHEIMQMISAPGQFTERNIYSSFSDPNVTFSDVCTFQLA